MTYSPKITNANQLGTGTPDGTKVLFGDLTWDTPSGGSGITGLTGDVTASGTGSVAATIAADAVTNAKLAEMAANTIKGNNTGSPANPSDLTASQVKTLLAIAAGDVSGLGSAALVSTAAFDSAGTASSAVAAHVAAPDPHPQYALESSLGTLASQNGTFSGTSSGTNTGDQTITLTGNVTGSGTGSFAATIANDAVTYAKMQNVSAASRLLGRGAAAGAGDVEEITLGTGLSMSGTTLSATGGSDPSGYTVIVKSGNQDVTNAGVTNDTDFSFPVTANTQYAVQMDLYVSGNNTTADYRMDLRVDAGTIIGKGTVQNLTAAGAVQNIILTANAAANTTAVATGIPTANLNDLVAVRLIYAFTPTNTTTFRFRFGNATPTTGAISRTWKGSVMRYKSLV